MLFGCERSCSSHRRVSNCNSKVPQGGIYPQIKFERDTFCRLNIFRVRVFTSSGSTGGRGGGDAKTIISPNTSFGDIITSVVTYRAVHSTNLQDTLNIILQVIINISRMVYAFC